MTNWKKTKKEVLKSGEPFDGYPHRRHRKTKKELKVGTKKDKLKDIEHKETIDEIKKAKH